MADGFTWRDNGADEAANEQREAEANTTPRTLEEVSTLIETLAPSMSPMALGSTIEMIIEGLARSGVDDAVAEPFLQAIKGRTRSPIRDLRKLLTKKRPEPVPVAIPLGVIEAMLVRYVYVKQVGAFWDRKARTVVKVHSVREAYWHEMPPHPFSENPGERIDPYELLIKGNDALGALKACDRADLFMFKPGTDEFFIDERGCRALNIWVKSELQPLEGDVQPFLDHVDLVLNGNEAMLEHQLDFLAHLVQRPHIKIKSTVLIIGPEGCGKTVIAEMMVELLGKDNVAFIDAADLENPFNSYMDGKILVVVNELIALSKPARNKLKAYITDSKMTINRKNVPTYDYQNYANFLMYSNYEDGAVIAEGDRRFGIEISRTEPRPPAYFSALWGWFNNGGKSHLLHYLQHRPLDSFDAFAPPPVTASKLQVIENSRDALDAYMRDAFAAGEAPFQHDLVTVNHVIDWFMEKRRLKVTHKQVSLFLRSIGAEWLGQRPVRGARPGVWAIRNGAEWAEVGNDEVKHGWRDIEEPPVADHIRDELLGRHR